MKYDLEADYVIVGAGSAGCVLANRLSADGKYRVILIEAGGDDRVFHEPKQFYSNLNIHIPAGFTRNYLEKGLNWNYMSEPEPGLNGRRLALPRGRVLGGSSSINGMIYARGLDSDFDAWRQAGCAGWAFEDILPYFRKSEDFQGGESRRHGVGGPLSIGYAPFRFPVGQAIIDAVAEMTGRRTDDINGEDQEGLTFSPVTARNGVRRSSSVAFLHPALKRPNLSVEKHALTEAVLFDGKKAAGIRFSRRGRTHFVRAHREVIVSGGAINSPQLLQLSGIGPADLLTEHGIAVLHDSPNVGGNLQDHLAVTLSVRLKPGTLTANQLTRGPALVGQIVKYAFRRTGLLTTGGAMVTGYARSRPDVDLPDLQLFFAPATVDMQKLAETSRMVMEIDPGLTLSAYKTRPASRGHVRIRSADPREAPAVLHNFLTDPSDARTAVDSFRFMRGIFSQPSLARHIDHIMRPGDEVQSDEELLDCARAGGTTAFHEAGSVAMGGRPDSALDPRLRVNGVTGLRVVDASVMPHITSGNTNAGTLMIAEKGADMILADAD